jgi:hypothetical protein
MIVCQGVASSGRCWSRQIDKLGALKQLTFSRFDELQEMPDLIELTALGSLTIEWCGKSSSGRSRGDSASWGR